MEWRGAKPPRLIGAYKQRSAGIPSRVIAICFALIGFAGGVVVGIASGNVFHVILLRAIGVMICCLVIGWIIGKVALRAVDLHVQRHKRDHSIPEDYSVADTRTSEQASPAAIDGARL